MKIDFTGRQTEISAELRKLAERKLAKVAKLLPSVTRAHVILTADKHRQVAEVSVHSRQLDLAAVEVSNSPQLSVSNAIEKLLRQVDKQRTRRRARKGAASPRLTSAAAPADRRRESAEAAAPRVIRSRRSAVKPMTLDEAALQLDTSRNDFVVFRDAENDRVSVLYKRRDEDYGLIAPEI
jgi:putative sigma-54 modulation protein